MIVLTVLAVSLRFVARKMSRATYGYDDWFALASLVRILRTCTKIC